MEAQKLTHRSPCLGYNFVVNGKIRIDKNKLKKLSIGSGPHLSELKIGKDIKYKGRMYKAKNLIYTEKGKRVSVIMDTTTNSRLPGFVKDSDLLIIESTYDAESLDLAKEHKHMTSKQAAEIAKTAKVGKPVLTHISQRYQQNPKRLMREAKAVLKGEAILLKDLDKIEL